MNRAASILILLALAGVSALAWALRPGGGVAQDPYEEARLRMVRTTIEAHGVRDSATLHAMRTVPRHEFVLPADVNRAYGDHPLPLTHGQTISQPFMVAYMTELVGPRVGMKALEVGTGSGYQAAVLAEAGATVYSVEIIGALASSATGRLKALGYAGVHTRHSDGFFGWEEEAPFDAIVVTAAAGYIPPPLIGQLRPGGRMVIPVGSVYGIQNLILVNKSEEGEVRTRVMMPVRFVPLVREIR